MGRTKWLFRCENCKKEQCESFQYLDKDEAVEKVRNIQCNSCGDNKMNMKPGRAGQGMGLWNNGGKASYLVLNCEKNNCEIKIGIRDKSHLELIKSLKEFQCACGSENFTVRDSWK